MKKPLILVVEDEPDLRSVVEYNLRLSGYDTISVGTAREALQEVMKRLPDLVLLDLMLPDFPGTQVCRDIRDGEATRDIPILMLTAKGEETSRVKGLELGADDYVVKPVSMRELVLRVAAVLRRRRSDENQTAGAGRDPATTPVRSDLLVAGSLQVDLEAHQARVDGKPLDLTPLEFKLLATLVARAGRAQTRERLLQDVWGVPGDLETRTVDTHVKRLRSKLGSAGSMLETVRGFGYRFGAGA